MQLTAFVIVTKRALSVLFLDIVLTEIADEITFGIIRSLGVLAVLALTCDVTCRGNPEYCETSAIIS